MLYIGQSVDVAKRIAAHRSTRLDFAGYFVDEYPKDELDAKEIAAIQEFKPLLNERS